MHLSKPVHWLLAGVLGGVAAAAAFALLRGRLGLWAALIALVCLPPAWLLGSIVVDLADGVLRRPWGRGAVIGLMVAAVVPAGLAIGFDGVRVLAAIPPFLYGPLLKAPQPLLWALFAAWWGGVGALVGWGIARGVRGRVGAALFLVVLGTAHLQTLASIERGLAGAADAMARILGTMLTP